MWRYFKWLIMACFVLFQGSTSIGYAQELTKPSFNHLSPALYQIRIIDVSSGQKSSIGTGFQISAEGLIVTNYHVIAQKVLSPNNVFIEYEDFQGHTGQLTLHSVDVVNDLALLGRMISAPKKPNIEQDEYRSSSLSGVQYLSLSSRDPEVGDTIYSLGNPHDLGMIISPGIYNGIKKDSFYNRVHFTGSINSGMSGGPVVNANEQVVGINVATAGNSIGFLIPRMALVNLINRLDADKNISIKQQIHQRLFDNQNKLIDELLTSKWSSQSLGEARVPINLSPSMKCWGQSNASHIEALYKIARTKCNMSEDIYLSHQFRSGHVNVEYYWYDGSELSSSHFYNLYQQFYDGASADNRASKEDVTAFQCHNDFVKHNDSAMTNKVAFCTRAYKEYPDLFDVLYMAASVDHKNNGLISHFTLAGVSQESAMAFTEKFMAEVKWQ